MPVHAVDELPELLGSAEIVIVSLPGGDETRHIVDDAFLAALPDGALVVNVGRGPLIDTDALVDHVDRGRIRAALDVTDPEPLPADHPLWSLPGVADLAARRRRVDGHAAADRAARAHADRADAGGRAAAERRLRELIAPAAVGAHAGGGITAPRRAGAACTDAAAAASSRSVGAAFDDLTAAHHDRLVAHASDDGEVVADDQQRQAALAADAATTSRTCAWTETSSALVASSITSTSGSIARARAIATRWR